MTKDQLLNKLADLEIRLQEAEETLDAIRNGSVDAVVVSGTAGEQVYTLQSADQPYRLLVESISEGTVTISTGGTILYSNTQFAEMMGYPLERIIGASFTSFISKEDRHLVEQALHTQRQKVFRFPTFLNSYEMGKIPAQITLSATGISNAGTLTAIVTDLSEQLRYQEIVREEKLSRSIMDNSPNGIAVCDAQSRIIRSSRALNMFCRGSVLMKFFDEVFQIEIKKKNGAPVLFSLKDVLSGKPLQTTEAGLYCYGKEALAITFSAFPLLNENNDIIGCLVTMTDISERKKAEEELRLSEERFRLALKNSPVSVAIQDLDLVYQWAYNQRTRRADEVIGKTDSDLFTPEDAAWILEQKRQVLESGTEMHVGSWLTSNGRRLFLDLHYEPLRDVSGVINGIGIAVVDLTEQKQAEEREKRQRNIVEGINKIFREAITCKTEEQLGEVCLEIIESLTESSIGFIGEIGPDNKLYDITISNPGWEICAMIDQTGHRRVPGSFKVHGLYGRVLHDGKSLMTNDPAAHPDSIGIPSGHPPITSFLGTPLIREGETIGLIAVGNRDGGYMMEQQETLEALAPVVLQALLKKRTELELQIDITRRRQAEEALSQQSEKLEAANKELESFAYSVSHDLRAPLRAIDGFSRMLLVKMADKMNDDEKRRFDVIREGTQRMGQLIDDVLAFSRLGRQAMLLGDINMLELINQVWEELLAINPGRRMSLKMNALPTAFGDTTLMRQVLANLLSNAVKFTRKKEVALIEIGGKIVESETVYFVRDNGAGFDMGYYEKLFGVFQRLHSPEEYEGNGAGLAIVSRIVQRHGGRVWAEGETDKGAIFHFSLPVKNKIGL